MKRIISLLVLFVVLFSGATAVTAQNDYVDLRPIRHITQKYIDALTDKNILVFETYKCGTLYKKDWTFAYVKLTGVGFPWTDQYGRAHLHFFTANPPMVLEGFRPPQTLHTSPYDMDGNLVLGDYEGYFERYRQWEERPCVDLTLSLFSQDGFANAWANMIAKRSDIHKYKKQWEALGLDGETALPVSYLTSPCREADCTPIRPLFTPEEVLDWTWGGNHDLSETPLEAEFWAGEAEAETDNMFLALVVALVLCGVGTAVAVRGRV